MTDINRSLNDEMLQVLHGLIRNWEHEVVEFKQASNDYDKDKIGQYFSAISNEANLKGLQYLDEFEDMVIISNPGSFLPGDIREVLKPGYTAPYYRNQLLADAMVKFNMIDTVQMGIRNVYVSATIAEIIDERAQYTKNKAMDDNYYMDLIINYLQQFGSGTKADFIRLLGDKLSDVLEEKQKDNKVRYFLTTMSRNGLIERTTENKRTGAWRLAK